MTDTKKLIEEARKLVELKKEEVIESSLNPASPTPSTNVSPQDMSDRIVAIIDKLASLKVSASGNAAVDIYTMDASTDDKKLVSNGRVYEIANYEVGLVKVIDSSGNVKDLNTIDGKTEGGNYHLVTKHYVDDKKADSGLVVTKGNGDSDLISSMDGTSADKKIATVGYSNTTLAAAVTKVKSDMQLVIDGKADGTLKVGNSAGNTVALSTMDGSTDDKTLLTAKAVTSLTGLKANANLKVHTSTGADVDLSTMDGTADDKKLTTVAYSDTVYATKSSVTSAFNTNIQFVSDDGTIVNIKVKGA